MSITAQLQSLRPGTTDAVWAPSDLGSNLKGWWKADAGVRARTAAQFTKANSESLSRANSAAMNWTNKLTIAGWIYFDATTNDNDMVTRRTGGDGVCQFIVSAWTNSVMWLIFDTGATITAKGSTALSTGTWYYVVVVYDGEGATDADKVKMWVNGAAQTITFAGTIPTTLAASTTNLIWGGQSIGFLGGRLANCAIWSRALSSAEAALLYNSGAGVRYSDAVVSYTSLVGWWEMDENSGTRADKSGNALTLTDNNTVTANDGKVDYAAADGDAVWKWEDQSGTGVDLTQTTHSTKPIYKTSIINGLPVVRFDGTDDVLINSGDTYDSIGTFSAFGFYEHDSAKTGTQIMFGKGNTGSNQEFDFEWDRTAQKHSMVQGGGTVMITSTDEIAEDEPHYFYCERSGSAGAWGAAIRTDGVANGTAAAFATNPAGDSAFGIGNLGSGAAAGFSFKGDIGELSMIDDVLAAGNITLAESYLATRSGV